MDGADGAGALMHVLQVGWKGCVMHLALLRQLCVAVMSVLNSADGAGALLCMLQVRDAFAFWSSVLAWHLSYGLLLFIHCHAKP
jgi:hypothetical protein